MQFTKKDSTVGKLPGLIASPVTPLTADDRVDGPTLQKMVDFLIREGIQAIAPLLHVGENLNLSIEERQEVARLSVEAAGGRVPIFVHTSLPCTQDVVALSRHAQSIGASGVIVVAPYYWSPPYAALLDHFVTVASSIDISLFAYNSPYKLGVNLTPEFLIELIERCPNFVGLKDASFDMKYFTEICRVTRQVRPGFAVYPGIEYILPCMVLGGAGTLSVCGPVAPRLLKSLYDACVAKDYDRAQPLQHKISQLLKLIMVNYPATIRAAMEIMGRPNGQTRKPILPLNSDAVKRLEANLDKLGILSDEPHGW